MKKSDMMQKVLDGIERAGNKLPQPVTLFALLMIATLILSWIFGGISVEHPGNLQACSTVVAIRSKA